MKKAFLVFSLVAVLAAPVMAAPRDDDPRGSRDGVVARIVLLLKRLIGALPLEGEIGPPKP